MTDGTQELDEILQPIRNYADIVEIDVAKQAILQWVADEVLSAGRRLQKRELWGESADVLLDHIIENQEVVLKQHGWKEGE